MYSILLLSVLCSYNITVNVCTQTKLVGNINVITSFLFFKLLFLILGLGLGLGLGFTINY